jgi:23S rRNA pseudouridine2605 synthase
MTAEGSEKLQKALAAKGVGSRRMIEDWIAQGRVQVNGVCAHLGQRVQADDTIHLDGQLVTEQKPQSVEIILYHKPEGELCTRHDPENRPTVFDHLPEPSTGKWVNIGRLDLNTTGLLLLTNSGELANKLMHPKEGCERVYLARIRGELTDMDIKKLKTGISLEDGLASFSTVSFQRSTGQHNTWYQVSVHQGRNRIVRRLFEALGHEVSRLMRIQYGDYVLPRTLKPGQYQVIRS